MHKLTTLTIVGVAVAALVVGYPSSSDAAASATETRTLVVPGNSVIIFAMSADTSAPQLPSPVDDPAGPELPGTDDSGSTRPVPEVPDDPEHDPDTESSPLLPPTDLSASVGVNGAWALTWVASESASEYLVERAHGEGAFELIGTTAETLFVDLDAAPITTYAYRVYSLNADGERSSDFAQVDVEMTPPGSPVPPPLTPTPLPLPWEPTENSNEAAE